MYGANSAVRKGRGAAARIQNRKLIACTECVRFRADVHRGGRQAATFVGDNRRVPVAGGEAVTRWGRIQTSGTKPPATGSLEISIRKRGR